MASLGGLFVLAYLACVIAVIIFVLRMLWPFVRAHERLAGALDTIARKLRDDARQEESICLVFSGKCLSKRHVAGMILASLG